MVKPTQHYRWDFIGLSTDTKPTADNSEKVADGSTFYCSDNSKLYVWYDDQWYEKEDGGESYVLPIASEDTLGGVKVGSGLEIDSETGALSVSGGPTTVIQNAGAPTTATEGTVGLLLEDTTNGKLYQCTAVNEPADDSDPTTYTWVEVGQDLVDGVIIKNAGAPTTATVGAIGLLLEDTTNGKLYQCTAVNVPVDESDPTTYTWVEVGAGGGSVTVVQTAGTSQTDVMSQDAATGLVYTATATSAGHHYYDAIRIGNGVTLDSTSTYSVTIGNQARNECNAAVAIGPSTVIGSATQGIGSVAIGEGAECHSLNSIALGNYSRVSTNEKGVMDIGLHGVSSHGYSSSNYRLLRGLYTARSYSDPNVAANLEYVNWRINAAGTTAPTTSTVGVIGGLYSYVDTTGSTPVTKIYQCTANSGSSYTWVDITTEVKAKIDGLIITNAGAPTTATVGTVGQLLEDTTNGKLYQCTAVTAGVDPNPTTYTWTEVGAGGGSGPTVVQTTGNSTTDVMSQDAVTRIIGNVASALNVINNGSNA